MVMVHSPSQGDCQDSDDTYLVQCAQRFANGKDNDCDA